MGCICSKAIAARHDKIKKIDGESGNISSILVSSLKREKIIVEVDEGGGATNGTARLISDSPLEENEVSTPVLLDKGEKNVDVVEKPTKAHHQRRANVNVRENGGEQPLARIISMPHANKGEQVAAGWPNWLSSVAGEAIKGWVPRRADSFEKLDKIGQGTYSNVYRARDLETGKVVALKKVRFVNMDPESVRFMAREITILRRLDHPNVVKLEGLVTSRMSGSLYLVFEYMEHDLAGLAAVSSTIKFTESQIKCYMQQLLCGLEHCHSRGVLHRDIKGSNLLIDNNGILRIADFGLATIVHPGQNQPLTSRVVTLWYRPPELLLGATEYGVAVDLWSSGCILAELLVGKPIMPGRTEVEQLHKIFKLCGSPSEEYWKKSRLPHATIFKPQHPYKRCVSETFKDFPPSSLALLDVLLAIEPENRGSSTSALQSEFFTTGPLPCDPSSLPKYPPSKEFDAKLRNEKARRQKAAAAKGSGSESGKKGSRDSKAMPGQDVKLPVPLQGHANPKSISEKYTLQEDSASGFPIEPPRGNMQNGISDSCQLLPPSAYGSSSKKKDDGSLGGSKKSYASSARSSGRLDSHSGRSTHSQWPGHSLDRPTSSHKQNDRIASQESKTGYAPKKNKIHYSGPLMPPGGNIEEMLKEHERQIQEAVRKARLDRAKTKKNYADNATV
ncbi:hypothetical protein IFM89_020230 [Coptis chinensis]|uniref:Protein kinase domain-containing protein n=1 Tax=Coptis chinensis TaxID=261450 RepID=A0A835LMV0_9MAGN|nr:hypothetical protein IFM89_020230 [Coptis chinensis]